jgi:predicted small metal-binding protein
MDQQTQIEVLKVVLILAAMCSGWMAVTVVKAIIAKVRLEYEYMKHPRLVPYDASKKCEDRCNRKNVALALRGIPYGMYLVCIKCGTISGNDQQQVSKEVLEHMIEALKLADEKEAAANALQARINAVADAVIDRYIQTNLMGHHDQSYFRAMKDLVRYSFAAQAEARDKVLAEQNAQTELDKRYAGWDSKVKGRA